MLYEVITNDDDGLNRRRLNGVYQFGQPGDFAAGGGFVNDPFAGRFVDIRRGAFHGGFRRFEVAGGDGFANLFDIGAHG